MSSVLAIGGTVVAVGPTDKGGMDQPLSFIVGEDEAPRSLEDSTAGWTVVAKAVAGDGIAIAIGQRDGQAVAWRSSDGLDWSEIPLPNAAGDSLHLIDVVFAGDRWAILGKQKGELVVMVGPEATDWQTNYLSFPPRVNKVGGARLGHHESSLHVIGTGQPRVGSAANHAYTWTSTDGVTWSAERSVPAEVFGDGHFFLKAAQTTSEATVLIGRAGYRSEERYSVRFVQMGQHQRLALRPGLGHARHGVGNPLLDDVPISCRDQFLG